MLRSLLIFFLCGTLAACASDRDDYNRFEVRMDTGEDAFLYCVEDPAKEGVSGHKFTGDRRVASDYPLMADGKSHLVTYELSDGVSYSIYSPVDAEPCKSLVERDANISAGEAGEAAAAFAAGVLLGILICVPTFGALCP
ncbi:hypothetical protein [Ruegeria sp. HKCCA6837]|uniref:hypothetical protein n=1 Tax=Ruegeria sp. HKCCA6837 TaxID=2682989 RepID=UPI00148943A9|nr:hypothetical protein [Ruegeria sp. HKCCA6837]